MKPLSMHFQHGQCLTSAVSMGTITTSLLEGCSCSVDADIHAVLLGRGRSHLETKRTTKINSIVNKVLQTATNE